MNQSILTNTQIGAFKHDGYTLIPTLFDEREVEALLREYRRMKDAEMGRNVTTRGDGETVSTEHANYQIIPVNNRSALMRALPFCPKVLDIVREVMGYPVSRHLDQIFSKPGHGVGVGTNWHTDNAYFKVSNPTMGVGMWIAVTDANEANGTMRLVPGSFRNEYPHERDPNSDHHITVPNVDESQAITVEVKAGGCALFNYGVLHCTKVNDSAEERVGLAYHFLRTDHAPESALQTCVHLTGDLATGGVREYGVSVASHWDAEVSSVLASTTASPADDPQV